MTPLRRSAAWLFVLFLLALAAAPLAAQARPAGHVFGNPNLWQYAPSRAYHVLNYRIRLKLDEPRHRIAGAEVVTLRPFAAGFRRFFLDSAGLAITSVSLLPARGAAVPLRFQRADPRLRVTLDRAYGPADTLRIGIAYSGAPNGRGLTFIQPSAAHPQLREVWSYGWPENNHYWFPCWDYPNDKATSETIITVPAGQSVVSNGHLARVTRQGAWVTYDWIESVPHSSYLVSIAAAPWRKVEQHLGRLPVDYYVPPYVSRARALRSFHLTPDMIAFYAHVYGVPYPYGKYAQVAAHHFGGGLENMSATTLTDTTLHSARADPDFPSTELVAHELAHQWFGDLVTERSWAGVWLSEGFATYSAALYLGHHAGVDAYRYQIWQDQNAARSRDLHFWRRPMFDRHYTQPWGIMGATTYQKGAAVLDMMRYVLDRGAVPAVASPTEPFFRSLRLYLETNRAQNVDDYDLLAAIRRTTGRNLQWFFHEWVHRGGFPQYQVRARYRAAHGQEIVTVAQTQTPTAVTPIFRMPVEVAFYGPHGREKTLLVRDDLPQQTFVIPLAFRPLFTAFDPDDRIYKTVNFSQPVLSLVAAAETAPATMTRLWAAQQLGRHGLGERPASVAALAQVLAHDGFYGVRQIAARSLGELGGAQAQQALLANLDQPDSRARTAVVTALGAFHSPAVFAALRRELQHDGSYAAQAAAARALGQARAPGAFELLDAALQNHPSRYLLPGLMEGLAATGNPAARPVLEHLATTSTGMAHYIALRLLHRPIHPPR
ncbi:MAG: M1 family aminopeptidase [Terriglobales bacterium]